MKYSLHFVTKILFEMLNQVCNWKALQTKSNDPCGNRFFSLSRFSFFYCSTEDSSHLMGTQVLDISKTNQIVNNIQYQHQ